jgi:hypothetical protein
LWIHIGTPYNYSVSNFPFPVKKKFSYTCTYNTRINACINAFMHAFVRQNLYLITTELLSFLSCKRVSIEIENIVIFAEFQCAAGML